MPLEIVFDLDGVEETLLNRRASQLNMTPEEVAALMIHERLNELAEELDEDSGPDQFIGGSH